MTWPKQPAAVLWDMDGTLVDSEHYWLGSEQELAAEYGKTWTEQDGISLIGMSLYDSSEVMRERMQLDLPAEAIIARMTDFVVAKLNAEIPWRPGAKQLLQQLREAGIKTALVTMSMRRMAKTVADAIDFDAFDVIVAGDDVTHGKPHPEPYLLAAKLLDVDIRQCVAFEDSISGLASAEASGAIAIGVPNIVQLPEREGRILWSTLQEKTISDLTSLFETKEN